MLRLLARLFALSLVAGLFLGTVDVVFKGYVSYGMHHSALRTFSNE